ncbi:polysaccharide biosynthesis tyrosine autokinase [Anaerostipes faecalis]|uniref:polysaccharide biosynthesis tyrosine autokinase n=1 Tax=Anaerostipes faecalis TaxID=2738446 RepID=UPI003F087328
MDDKKTSDLIGQVDILSIVKDIFRQWWVILLLAVSISLFARIWVRCTWQPEYTVNATFVVTSRGINTNVYQNLSSAKELAEQFSQVLESNLLKRKVAEELQMDTFRADTQAQLVPETNLMELKVTAGSSMEAYHVMKSILKNYNAVSDYVIENVVLEMIQQPAIPTRPSNSPDIRATMKKSFLITAILAALMFALFSYMKDTVKNEREVVEKVAARYLGTIYHEKKVKSLVGLRKNKSLSMLIQNQLLSFRFVESVRMTAASVRSQMKKHDAKVLLITSVMENEGKSTVAANLAMALAQENNNVLLIDGDFRKPAQYKIFDIPEKEVLNLPEILENRGGTTSKILKKEKNINLYTIFNRTSTTSLEELLEKGTLQLILQFARKKMDYIIMDTSPMALVSDTEELAQLADASILVVRQDTVLARHINDAIDVLNNAHAKVLGCIFNDVVPGIAGRIGHYGYGGYYGYGGHYAKRYRKQRPD